MNMNFNVEVISHEYAEGENWLLHQESFISSLYISQFCFPQNLVLFLLFSYLFSNMKWTAEGNGKPLQCSCLGNPMDRGAWWATGHGVARVRKDLAAKPPPLQTAQRNLECWTLFSFPYFMPKRWHILICKQNAKAYQIVLTHMPKYIFGGSKN